jgi:ubiquitin C-terminal hydrolase
MDKQYGLSGLMNMGNTCYMNSVLQCLSNCDLFREYLFEATFVKSLVDKCSNENETKQYINRTMSYQLFRVIKGLWRENDCILTVASFKQLLGSKINEFYGFSQNDSQEALIFILDLIHEELKVNVDVHLNIGLDIKELMSVRDKYNLLVQNTNDESVKKFYIMEYEKYKRMPDNRDVVTKLKSYKDWSNYKKTNGSIITDLFTGLQYSQLMCCECGNRSDTFEPFNMLQLSIPQTKTNRNEPTFHMQQPFNGYNTRSNSNSNSNSNNMGFNNMGFNNMGFNNMGFNSDIKSSDKIDIYDCLKEYCKEEILDDDNKWNCDGCKKKVNAKKTITIWRKPKILIVHLKRFNYVENRKISDHVEFPLTNFNINDIMSPINNDIEIDERTYSLFAISLQIGNMQGGHYYSYCKNDTGWFEFNDEHYSKIDDDKVCNKNAYLLFYKLD